MKAALYARVSTLDRHTDNQLGELRRYVAARGWDAREFVDHGVSGAKANHGAMTSVPMTRFWLLSGNACVPVDNCPLPLRITLSVILA
jgi:hypothetical protein